MKPAPEPARAAALVLAVLLVVPVSCARRETGPAPAAPAETAESLRLKETTVRNVTDHAITYRVYPAGKPEAVETREIGPGAVDRFRTAGSLEIEFTTGKKDVLYSLDPGSPYSFRYDEGTTIDLFLGSHGRADAADLAPWVPTPQPVVDKMLELAQVTKDDIVYDLGCGDGRIPVTAAQRYGCRAWGYDIDPRRIKESLENVEKNDVGDLVTIERRDIFTLDLSGANVVTLYLLPSLNVKLIPQLEKLKPGSRIVSHDFSMKGVIPDKVVNVEEDDSSLDHTIYLWTTPLKKEQE